LKETGQQPGEPGVITANQTSAPVLLLFGEFARLPIISSNLVYISQPKAKVKTRSTAIDG
jgi:hypothetical protein